MFSGIRLRLTLLYTLLTTLALAGFALLFYFALTSALLQEKERDLQKFALHISREATEMLRHDGELRAADSREMTLGQKRGSGGRHGDKAGRGPHSSTTESPVVFVVNRSGAIIEQETWSAGIRPPQAALAAATSGEEKRVGGKPDGVDVENQYLWVILPLRDDGRLWGGVIIGRDLAEYDHFVVSLIHTLLLSLLLFPLFSGLIGYFAAGRAMKPIHRSFEAQRRFVADASHELRTPLSVIQASLDVVEKEDGNRLSPLSRQIFDDLKDETRRMARLAGNLLLLAQVDAGDIQTVRESFGVLSMIEAVVRTMLPLAESKGVSLKLGESEDAVLSADRDRITQLLMILVDNGIKFTPPGGAVRLSCQRQGEDVLLSVADTGIGLSGEDRRKIFERFYRVDKARSREDGGAGLGLSIAAWIVSAHGGKIEVMPRESGGSEFRVVLPAG